MKRRLGKRGGGARGSGRSHDDSDLSRADVSCLARSARRADDRARSNPSFECLETSETGASPAPTRARAPRDASFRVERTMTRASMAWRLAPAPSTRPREPARRSGRLESRRPSSRAVRVTIASSAAPDDAAVTASASARASTGIVAPDVRARLLHVLLAARLSVVVSLSDDADPPDPSHLRVVTAAHVACLAGPRNSLRVRFPGVPDAPDRRARVIAVHPTLVSRSTTSPTTATPRARVRRRRRRPRRGRRSRMPFLTSANPSPRSDIPWDGPAPSD